jgi:hypothetical protein
MNPKVQLLPLPPEIKHRINEYLKAQKFIDVVKHLEEELYFWLHGTCLGHPIIYHLEGYKLKEYKETVMKSRRVVF